MIVVLDVSAAIEIILQKKWHKQLFNKCELASWIIAPDLYVAEATNTLWKYQKANLIAHEDCVQFIEDALGLVDDYFATSDIWKEVFAESAKSGHSAYDMFYVVLARRNDATLLTCDKQLAEICQQLNVDCLCTSQQNK